jgi:hypothetical protein
MTLIRARQRGAVDGGDHQDLRAFGDHVLDLRQLIGYVVFGVLQVRVVTLFLEVLDHAGTV